MSWRSYVISRVHPH